MDASQCKKHLALWLADGSFGEKLPEVAALRGVLQADEYHAEGDAFVHTMLAVEAVNSTCNGISARRSQPFVGGALVSARGTTRE